MAVRRRIDIQHNYAIRLEAKIGGWGQGAQSPGQQACGEKNH